MKYTKQQIDAAYKKNKPDVRNFINDNETTELIEQYLNNAGLNDDQTITADGEILYGMYGLQTLSDTISNIAQYIGKGENDLSVLKNNLQKNIFDKIEEIKNKPQENEKGGYIELDKNVKIKISEIAKKYNLNTNQEESLLELIANIDLPSDELVELKNIISKNIGTSDLISEQITEDLKNRAFAEKKKSPPTDTLKKINATLPEIRPDNLPAVETVNQTGAPSKTSVPVYTPKPKFMVEKEPVQSPVSVPRFKAVPMGDEEMIGQNFIPNIAPKPNASGIIESKLNSITKNIEEVTKTEPPKTYTKDPYREPIN